MSTSETLLARTCEAFDLGALRTHEPVVGGLSNAVERGETSRGLFAIKRMIAGTDRAAFEGNVESSFRVEAAAYASGLPMPRPVSPSGTDRCLARIPDADGSHHWMRVHAWVNGRIPGGHELDEALASRIGRMLAAIHGLEVGDPGPDSSTPGGPPDWDALTARAADRGVDWAEPFGRLLPHLDGLVRLRVREPRQLVPAHRDVDPKNTLLTPAKGPVLLDWDAAGYMVAAQEVTSALLDWSGARSGEPDPAIVRGLLTGYAERSGKSSGLDPTGWIDSLLGWLEYNVEVALGDRAGRTPTARTQLDFFFAQLPRIAGSLPRWLEQWNSGTHRPGGS